MSVKGRQHQRATPQVGCQRSAERKPASISVGCPPATRQPLLPATTGPSHTLQPAPSRLLEGALEGRGGGIQSPLQAGRRDVGLAPAAQEHAKASSRHQSLTTQAAAGMTAGLVAEGASEKQSERGRRGAQRLGRTSSPRQAVLGRHTVEQCRVDACGAQRLPRRCQLLPALPQIGDEGGQAQQHLQREGGMGREAGGTATGCLMQVALVCVPKGSSARPDGTVPGVPGNKHLPATLR